MTEVLSLDETRVDERYVLVRALFVWRFHRAPAQPRDVQVNSTFILTSMTAPKIQVTASERRVAAKQ
jgi:hypothetical protein